MRPDHEGVGWAIYNADCVEILAGLPDEQINERIGPAYREAGLQCHDSKGFRLARVFEAWGVLLDGLRKEVSWNPVKRRALAYLLLVVVAGGWCDWW